MDESSLAEIEQKLTARETELAKLHASLAAQEAEPQRRAEVQEVIADLRSYLDSLTLDDEARPAVEQQTAHCTFHFKPRRRSVQRFSWGERSYSGRATEHDKHYILVTG